MTSPAAWLLIKPIRFYQRFITPYTPASCRHYPTCSTYAVTALRTRGAVIGTALTIWRLLRCNPWSAGGIDYVPPKGYWRNAERDSQPRAGAEPVDRCHFRRCNIHRYSPHRRPSAGRKSGMLGSTGNATRLSRVRPLSALQTAQRKTAVRTLTLMRRDRRQVNR